MKMYNEIDNDRVASLIKERGEDFVFLHHTGNMYGIGCLADNRQALEKINRLKRRTDNKSFILLVPDLLDNNQNLQDDPYIDIQMLPRQKMLMEQYWPGNLTICFNIDSNSRDYSKYSHLVQNDTIAVRCPDDSLLRKFIRLLGRPIISTSINIADETPLQNPDIIMALDWFDFGIVNKNILKDKNHEPKCSSIVGFDNDKLKCYRKGSIPFVDIKKSYEKPLILFICTGNICRSPMAEYYARDLFNKKELPFRTASAGVFASGYSISTNSKRLLKNDNIELPSHQSQQITKDIMDNSWLTLAMEPLHKTILLNMFPMMKHKIYTLAEYCDAYEDISDPFTRDLTMYRNIYDLIKKYIDILAQKLKHKLQD